jgi:predicted RNase H-like HicB family nuclease
MQIPILIERIDGNGFLARGGEPLALTAEGGSKEEALANLKEKLQARLAGGALVVPFDLPAQPHPLAEFVGMFKDDPLIKEWKKSMKAYRKKRDKDADKP